MENRKQKVAVEKFKSFISRSSKQLLFFLLEDHPDKKKEQELIIQRLQEAIAHRRLVVLQVVVDETTQKYESIAGFIVSKDAYSDGLLIRPMDNSDTLRFVPVANIKKVAMLERHGYQEHTKKAK